MNQSMRRLHLLSGIGIAFGAASAAQAQQCSSEPGTVHSTISAVEYCPEDICETGKYPRFRTWLRRMSWKHNTTHSHFMYESCPPYWQPGFGYYETGWRRGEALPPPCQNACPPVHVPVCPPAAPQFHEPLLETPAIPPEARPATDIPQPEPATNPGASPQPTPVRPAVPEPQALPPSRGEPSASTQPARETTAPVTVSDRAPDAGSIARPANSERPADTKPARTSVFETAVAGWVANEVFPEGGTQARAFPLRPLPDFKAESIHVVTAAHRDVNPVTQPVEAVDLEEYEFLPIEIPQGSPLGMAVTTGEYVMKSVIGR